MRTLSPFFLIAFLGVLLLPTVAETEELSENERGVRAAVEDYVLGFYEAAPERLERSVSKELVKFGFWRRAVGEEYKQAKHMTFDAAIELAKTWNNDGKQGKDLPYEIKLFEVADITAAAKVTAKWGQDYFHLVKEDGKWKIHHVLWQSAPPVVTEASSPR